MNYDNDKIIEIFSGTLWEAEMVRTLLADAEIEAFTRNTMINSYLIDPIRSSGVFVMISKRDSVRAKEVVDRYYANMK